MVYLIGEFQKKGYSGEDLPSIASFYYGLELMFYLMGGGLLFGAVLGFLYVNYHRPDLSDVMSLAGKTFLIVCACRLFYALPREQMYYLPMIEPALLESGGILLGALACHLLNRKNPKQTDD